jgi:hypothetical protein
MPLYSLIYLYMMVAVPDGPLRHQILAYGHLKDGRLEIITEGDSTFIDTLDGFRRFWNHANTIQAFLVTEFSKVIHSVANGRITTDLRWETGLKSEDLNRLSLERRGVGSSNRGKRCYPEIETLFQSHWRLQFNTFFCTWIPNNQGQEGPDALVLLANSRDQELPTNLRAWLADEFRLSTVGGTFEEQFSALHRVTTDYQELELRKVGRIIGAELQRSGDRVEFLGLKFPERVISTWGVVIIASIQLYFYLHLRAFRSRLTPIDPGLNLAWIGLYPDRLAFVVSLVTISLLPMGVISYLAYLVMQSGRPQWVIDFKALGFLAFLLLGFCVACASFNLIWDLNSLSKWRRDLSR